jgi:hypothetical protein
VRRVDGTFGGTAAGAGTATTGADQILNAPNVQVPNLL